MNQCVQIEVIGSQTTTHKTSQPMLMNLAACCVAQLRALLPSKRIVLHDGLLPLGSALSMLDAGWDWPGLCLYGHGMFVATKSLEGEALQQIIQHATDMTSPR